MPRELFSGGVCVRAAAGLLALLLSLPVHAAGALVDAQNLSLFRQDPRDGKTYGTYPTWVLLNMQLRNVELPRKVNAGMVVSTWARVDPGQPRDGRTVNGDIGLAYVDGAWNRDSILLRAGRQMVFEGGTRGVHLDGGFVKGTLPSGLGASAWGGVPVRPMVEDRTGSSLAGARVFWRKATDTEVGASFVHIMELGSVSHQDLSLDGRLFMLQSVVLSGFVRWSTLENTRPLVDAVPHPSDVANGWTPATSLQWTRDATPKASDVWGRLTVPLQEAELAASWQPISRVQLMADYRRTTPGLFLSHASIFSVFSDERRDQVGSSVFVQPFRMLELQADAHLLNTAGGWGFTGGTRSVVKVPVNAIPVTVGGEARVLRLWNNGYWQARLFGSHRFFNVLGISGDADLHVLHQPVHGQWLEASLTGTTFVTLPGGFTVGGAVLAGRAPLVAYRVDAMARVSWGAAVPIQGRLF